jgi:hypothetical protein
VSYIGVLGATKNTLQSKVMENKVFENDKAFQQVTLSFIISALTVCGVLFINFQIAKVYSQSTGKTRALFGIIEMGRFGYQYYLAIGGLLAIILALLSFRKAISKRLPSAALIAGVIASAIVFLRLWTLMI